MNAKEYLLQIKVLENQVENKKLELESIYNQMTGLSGFSSDVRVSSWINTKSPQEKLIHKYIEYKEELNESIINLIEYKKEAMNMINKLNNAEYIDVLYKRYFQFKKWKRIAIETNYTYRGVLKIHNIALNNLEEDVEKRKENEIQS